ncbi:hypothetical protein GGX14DRAFT_394379 [Mycena pura]|uniref:Uncharacterized protein n=1 Tax=Mycena pura TaxID=153505 RepID=A0AAD6XY52_9AGAR|nr:hypothetical protein GGX14DRAFT_406499 [Mycena pura]KAJ7193272.1 hypothetical protein GGX14DRAFT_405708 [Mycena pura]KAJ7210746.1 hypothetical protein GGX14DRAFT_394379 [Mycena pura]
MSNGPQSSRKVGDETAHRQELDGPEADKSQKSSDRDVYTTRDPNSATLDAAHGLRWAAMARLPNWNPALIVIDPLHSICEGIPIELMEKAFKLEDIAQGEAAGTCG